MIATSYISVTDMFCGMGGSSEGAAAAGAEIVQAANHWELAIRSHNANHPNADHIQADIATTDPRRWRSSTILIASPECTNHSLAKGKATPKYTKDLFGRIIADPAEERSRATMWDVPRFAEVHRYAAVIVENVVDVRKWVMFDAWLAAMHALGYDHHCVYFNSMFAPPTPQSRDRIYIVFWRRGNRKPDLDIRPPAPCLACGRVVGALQIWKNPRRPWGRYGARNQYTYHCPDCFARLDPFYAPALTAIDWSIPAPRIGDRAKPLKDKTLARIRLGLERYKDRYLVLDTTYGEDGRGRATSIGAPWPTQTTRQAHGLVAAPLVGANRTNGVPHPVSEAAQGVNTGNHLFMLTPEPFVAELRNHAETRSTAEALATMCAGGGHHGLTVPPAFITRHYEQRGDPSHLSRGVDGALGSVTTADHHSLTVAPAFLMAQRGGWTPNGLDEAVGTQIASGSQHAIVQPEPFLTALTRDDPARPVGDPAPTQTGTELRGLTVPPGFLTSYYGTGGADSLDEPVPTVPTVDRHAVVRLPFVVSQYGDSAEGHARNPIRGADAILPTIPGMAVHRLAQPGPTPDIEDCGFRMLEPHEIKAAMAFRADYIVYGNKREQVKQAGNAVTPPVMRLLMERVLATLG